MEKAYDKILRKEVSADTAARNNGTRQPYRYKCLCCGEEVYVAAAYSEKQCPHFRHKRGNNNMECERYLTQIQSPFSPFDSLFADIFGSPHCHDNRRNEHKQAEFFYDNQKKIFEMGITFSENEIDMYEQREAELQLRENQIDEPFYSIKVNRANFVPNEPFMIPLNKYALNYYLSFSTEKKYWEEKVFKSREPLFFRIADNPEEFRAKFIRKGTLFTDTRYFVVFPLFYNFDGYKTFEKFVKIEQEDDIQTMKCTFHCIIIKIHEKSTDLDHILFSWGYQLDYAEEAKLLWPPVALSDGIYRVPTDYVVLATSFGLQAHSNIDLDQHDMIEIDNNISKLSIKKICRVYYKNTEMIFAPDALKEGELSTPEVKITRVDKFKVPSGDEEYYLYDEDGITFLKVGQTVYLTSNSKIIQYRQNYVTGYYVLCQNENYLDGEQLLNDILNHYKREVVFLEDEFKECELSQTAARYMQKCKIKGTINAVVKEYIKEGKI